MPSHELLIPFLIASAIFACVPGPGMFYAAVQTMARGRRAGWLSAIGFHLGGYAHIFAAAFGLAFLLQTVPVLFAIIKFAGAAYLIWLGARLIRSGGSLVVPAGPAGPMSSRRAIRQSLTVELLNPKTALFYLAFLPQFTDMTASLPIWAQILVLGTLVNFIFSLTDAACVLLSGKMTRLLTTSPAANRLIRRIGGSIVIALGVNLAAARQ